MRHGNDEDKTQSNKWSMSNGSGANPHTAMGTFRLEIVSAWTSFGFRACCFLRVPASTKLTPE